MIARESFEKSCPRFLSAAPFLCLIEDHLLCPDMQLLFYQLQEPFVDAGVVRQLRVERRHEKPSLARKHRMSVVLREHFDLGTGLLDPGRTDEHPWQGLALAGEVE